MNKNIITTDSMNSNFPLQMLNLFLALLLNSFASDSLQNKKEAAESKLILAFRKIGRFLKCLVRPCLCCKKYKNKNKIGDSVENLKALANGNGTTKKNGVIPTENGHGGKATIHEFIVVEDVGNNEDKISTIDIDNGSQTGRFIPDMTSLSEICEIVCKKVPMILAGID